MKSPITKLTKTLSNYIENLSPKKLKAKEELSLIELSRDFSLSEISNAFAYLFQNGIPPHGEVTRSPLTYLSDHPELVTAFNIGSLKQPAKQLKGKKSLSDKSRLI